MALTFWEISFPLKIPNVSELDTIKSTEIVVHGIPWLVEVSKYPIFNRLVFSFQCATQDNSTQWSYAAQISVKLLSFDPLKEAKEYRCEPHIFCNMLPATIEQYLIGWDELFDIEKSFVKDDTIQLDIKIEVADPSGEQRSTIKFEPLDKCCDDGFVAVFKLTVNNIDALMAVKTPVFVMRNVPWTLDIYKSRSNHLKLGLSNSATTSTSTIVCSVRIMSKLISLQPNGNSKETDRTRKYHSRNYTSEMAELASWKDLFDPQNGFVNNNSAVIEVKIQMDKPEGLRSIAKKRQATDPLETDAKIIRLECAICMNDFKDQNASSTECGHIFCTECIEGVIRSRERCPTCNSPAECDKLRRIYLPM